MYIYVWRDVFCYYRFDSQQQARRTAQAKLINPSTADARTAKRIAKSTKSDRWGR